LIHTTESGIRAIDVETNTSKSEMFLGFSGQNRIPAPQKKPSMVDFLGGKSMGASNPSYGPKPLILGIFLRLRWLMTWVVFSFFVWALKPTSP